MLHPSLLFFNLDLLGINSFGAMFSILILLFPHFQVDSFFQFTQTLNLHFLQPHTPRSLVLSDDLVIKLSLVWELPSNPAYLFTPTGHHSLMLWPHLATYSFS